MKRSIIALSLLAVLGVTACQNTGTWTPQSGGRTAGAGQVEVTKADTAVSKGLQK